MSQVTNMRKMAGFNAERLNNAEDNNQLFTQYLENMGVNPNQYFDK